MIIAKLRGGLGNQMFQYAFALIAAEKIKNRLVLDISYYRNHPTRSFMLDEFNTKYSIKIKNKWAAYLLRKTLRPIVIKEDNVNELYVYDKRNIFIDGFWESHKYLIGYEEFLRNIFRIVRPSQQFKMLLKKYEKENTIAVHVRRGDFLRATGFHFNQSEDFFSKAVDMIIKEKNLGDPDIVIFSDDKEWCKENLKKLAGFPAVVFDENLSAAEELVLMSHFGHNVISNSTFSWWAAFLNKNQNKIVVAPKKWRKDESKNKEVIKDLIIPDWKSI